MDYRNNITRKVMYLYLPIIVLFALIRMLSAFGVFAFMGNTAEYVFSLIIQVGLMFSVSLFGFALLTKNKTKQVFKFYGYRKINWKAILLAIAIGVIVYILNVFVSTFFSAFLSIFGYSSAGGTAMREYPTWQFILNILCTAILPAICEETAHRGLLLKGLSPMGQKRAIIISSIMFGLLHLNIDQFGYATLIGFLLGYISTICESIYPAMIIHFMNNFLSVFMGFSSYHKLGPEVVFSYLNKWLQNNTVLAVLFMLVLSVLLFFLLKYLVKLLFKVTTVKRVNQLQNEILKELTKEAYLKDAQAVAEGKEIDPTDQTHTIPFEKFDEMYKKHNSKMGYTSEIDEKILAEQGDFKLNKITKVMLITGMVIVSIITLFTFIWGIL